MRELPVLDRPGHKTRGLHRRVDITLGRRRPAPELGRGRVHEPSRPRSSRNDLTCVPKCPSSTWMWEGVSLTSADGVDTARRVRRRLVVTAVHDQQCPWTDLLRRQGWIASLRRRRPAGAEHGGDGPLLVPHLYLWKRPKCVREMAFVDTRTSRLWEYLGSTTGAIPGRRTLLGGLTWSE